MLRRPAPLHMARLAPTLALIALATVGGAQAAPPPQSGAPTPAWLPAAPLLQATDKLAAATGPNGLIYAVGGELTGYKDVERVEAYNPVANTWTAAPKLSFPQTGESVVTGANGLIYAIGGQNCVGGCHAITGTEAYNTATATWTTEAPTIYPTKDTNAVLGKDGDIYLVAGEEYNNHGVSGDTWSPAAFQMERYTPSDNTWTMLANLPVARNDLAAAVAASGDIYAMGGDGPTCNPCATVEQYTPATNSWTFAARMPYPVRYPWATVGTDGRFYVVGGIDGKTVLSTTQVYNPGTNTWTLGPSLAAALWYLTDVTGPDGRIFEIGGKTSAGVITSTVEAYGPMVRLQPASGPASTSITITGTNFAAKATVEVYWGRTTTGAPLAKGKTNAAGALKKALVVRPPKGARAGSYVLTVVDTTSAYPVTPAFVVTK